MRKKIFYILLIFFTLQSCGYTPLYSGLNKNNLKINIIEISGNDSMNEIVSLQLKRFSNNSSDNNKDLRVNTNYEKNILSKNKQGEATVFLIKTTVNFEVINSDKNENYSYKKNTTIDNISDKLELSNYENTIKENFLSSKVQELILKLSQIQ